MAAKENLTSSAKEIEEYMERKAIRQAQGWRPEPGTTMVATVLHMALRTDGDYEPYPVITYKLESGEVVNVHAFHTVLRERLAELETRPGLKQILSYDGKRGSNTRKNADGDPVQYHLYDVENYGDIEQKEVAEDFHF